MTMRMAQLKQKTNSDTAFSENLAHGRRRALLCITEMKNLRLTLSISRVTAYSKPYPSGRDLFSRYLLPPHPHPHRQIESIPPCTRHSQHTPFSSPAPHISHRPCALSAGSSPSPLPCSQGQH